MIRFYAAALLLAILSAPSIAYVEIRRRKMERADRRRMGAP